MVLTTTTSMHQYIDSHKREKETSSTSTSTLLSVVRANRLDSQTARLG